ncbi:type IV pilus modification protein PilV [Shewanella sp. Isolate11]|uniref:type IV pilus modification protein PilV n=1 Tax=Shewanella sp. Isolate11 TaxID=2908530 RepID=UPI001EFC59AC|nr:type IV pilus modification protein PilV [Shewanella sp. Isolate11]MCG9695990.1 type IV pilus modification protein PilV [Shewanella sp. Isolate11]
MRKYEKGMSLIEVMVSLIILVIGLVGIFNLHIVAKRGSFESFQQTQASYYANDIINRMRLNGAQLASYVGTYSGTPAVVTPACEGTTNCTPAQMAAWDLYEWQSAFTGAAEVVGSQNVGGLDTATACVQVNGNTVTVVMAWRGIRNTTISSDSPVIDTTTSCAASKENRRIFSIQTVII